MHKNSMIVVPGYYETRRKELETTGGKQERSGLKIVAVAAPGRTQGGEINEFQFQNIKSQEKKVTTDIEINKETEASWDVHAIRGETMNHGEYFMEKINEIDRELSKFDLENDSHYGRAVTAEILIDPEGMVDELAKTKETEQLATEARELLSEHTLKASANHVPITQTNPNFGTDGGATNYAPTWKRIPRPKHSELHESFSPPTLKCSGLDIDDHELPKKKKQVSHDDWKTTISLAEADIQPCQQQ